MRRLPVAIVGGGQAGLAVSWHLCQRGVEHLVLERDAAGCDWIKRRWDSFCLVTPNWQCRLPGWLYAGDDPEGFMVRDEIAAYLAGYVASFDPPLAEGVEVTSLVAAPGGGFELQTSDGAISAGQVVVATGGYHRERVPPDAAALPGVIEQVHSSRYERPDALPAGAVLVVGTGQSGCQIAEDLHLAGREVHLCVGGAPRVARRYRGRDVVAWLEDIGHYDVPIDEHPEGPSARHEPNHYVTGRDGGRDIDLRAFAREGMHLHGRLTGIETGTLRCAGDLAANLDAADATSERIKDTIDTWIEREGTAAPLEDRYERVWAPPHGDREEAIDVAGAGISSVIWSTGFTRDYRWVDLPAFDGTGYPTHRRGVTAVPGLSFVGLPWLHTWGSGRFAGVGADAEYLADRIAAAAGRSRAGHPALAAVVGRGG
jgi:putative flavoprotein involved in K+ transport